MIAGSYKSDRPINITGIDKNILKCDCIQGSKIVYENLFCVVLL